MWSLSGNQTLIPNNSDMHTYLTPGNYYCASNTNAETLKNSPLKFAFTMKVYLSVGIGSQYLIQEYTKYDASERILVYYDGNRNIWTSYHVQLEKWFNKSLYQHPRFHFISTSVFSKVCFACPD